MSIRILRIVVYAVGILVVVLLGLYVRSLDLDQMYFIAMLWIGMVITLFFYGNKFISRALDRLLPWKTYDTVRFFVNLLGSLLYALAIINVSYFVIKNFLTADPPTPEQLVITNLWGAILMVPAISIYFGIHFLKAWRRSELESERLQKENIKSQLDALKNHLDPHFLFNNLNILSALIDKDVQKSKEFLDKFAEVYRFLLKSKGSELISVRQELEFLSSYMYLITTRFGKNVSWTIDLNCVKDESFIPPLTLQMIFENGIKHNSISKNTPLRFELTSEENGHHGFIVLKNNVNPKREDVSSNKTGIKNIMKRYSHFTDQKVLVANTGTEFIVKIPIVEIDEI